MKTIPCIDIAEYDRIQALLEDPANFYWQAIDTETLDGWMPDLGLTNYDNPSIYRPPSIAGSGLASQLRHRFWRTLEQRREYRGERYVGVLLYDPVGEESPLELRLASEDIGRIEPARHDNHRHLIVADTPVTFAGGMEVFQLRAPGKGAYRIEAFVLLKERPAPSTFRPAIERLEVVVESHSSSTSPTNATAHFVTAQMATCTAEVMRAGEIVAAAHSDRARTLHALPLDGLAPNQHYTLRVTAIEKSGTQATAEVSFSTTTPAGTSQSLDLPLELINLSGADQSGLPMTFGAPLPQGVLFDDAVCSLEGCAIQVRPMAHWPDGSLKWALLDAPAPAAFAPHARRNVRVSFVASEIASSSGQQVLEVFDEGGRIEVASGRLRLGIDVASARLAIEKHHAGVWRKVIDMPVAELFSAATVDHGRLRATYIAECAIEERGTHRVAIRMVVDHADASGVARLRSNLRWHVFAGQPFIKLTHRLEIIDPDLPPAAGGDEVSTLLRLREFALHLPWVNTEMAKRVVHEHDLAHRIETSGTVQQVEGHADGRVIVRGQQGLLVAGARHFWQTYPKGLSVTPDGVSIELFPRLSGEALLGDEDAWHRLYFWLKDGTYLLKGSMALTNDVLIDFLDKGEEIEAQRHFAWLEQPPAARPAIDYLNATHALHPIAPKTDSPMPKYEALADAALLSFRDDQTAFRAYGQVNFGDWYGESDWSWGNNEYDPTYVACVEFLRGGDPRWAEWCAQSARHLADVDTINQSKAPEQVGLQAQHMPGHVGGYLPDYFRSKIAGTCAYPSHTWVEGPMLHSLLSGDAFVRESIEKTKVWLLRDRWFDNYDFTNCRESGWHLIHLCALAMGSDDPRSLNAASLIVRRVLEKEQPGGGWVHMLTESHCSCGYPRCRGEAGFMVGVLISALKRYHNLTGDPRVSQAIVGGTRWLIRETYDPGIGYFRYTSCKHRMTDFAYQKTQWVLEALADAYALSHDRVIGEVLKESLKVVGLTPEGPTAHRGLGKTMCMQMRYIPTVLSILKGEGGGMSG